MKSVKSPTDVWAQGSLQLLSPADLLETMARKGFSGRLLLASVGTPRQVVAVHLEEGRPVLVVGGEPSAPSGAGAESYRARQTLLRALGWTVGSFRVELSSLPPGARRHALGDLQSLLDAARARVRMWPRLCQRLPADAGQTMVAPVAQPDRPEEPHLQALLQALDRPASLADLGARTGMDEHLLLHAVVELAQRRMVRLGTAVDAAAASDGDVATAAAAVLEALEEPGAQVLKLTVLSWDSRTCYRTVDALLGRTRGIPDDIERQPRYQVLHETMPLTEALTLEVLAFRADAFEPVFAAPLVQNCHVFLLVTDMDAGHVPGTERPLVDRINELRSMFHGAVVAGRITVGSGAVTDPGCDVIIPELVRAISWSDLRTGLLSLVLHEVGRRLGFEVETAS